jgi:CBS domain containing-hemolysin-like protein
MAVAAFLTVYAAKVSGPELEKARFANVSGVLADRLRIHQNRANTLFLISIGFVIVAVAATWLIGASRSKLPTAAQWAVALVLVGFSVATLIYVALTGEAGARAVWGQ